MNMAINLSQHSQSILPEMENSTYDLVYNKELRALNVFELDIDYDKVWKLTQPHVEQLNRTVLYKPSINNLHLKSLSLPLYVEIPQWNSDIAWVSAAAKETFEFFDTCFNDLEIAEKTKRVTNLDFSLIMYSGFFVVRSYANAPHFHQDYTRTGINAFTLMTPVQINETADDGNLLYVNIMGQVIKYNYKKGKAITFGSDFIHSTEPFKSNEKFIFLCFTYGCTDLAVWDKIKDTAAYQGISHRNPNGDIIVTNPDFEQYF